jgi:rSAM/selenodomain-associated transferase 1
MRDGRPRLLLLAKAPVPGQVKTRMCPPCSHDQAAALAEAALHDTLAAVREVPDVRHVVVLDGAAGDWLPPGVEVVGQGSGSLGERLAAAFGSDDGPAFLVGMDTPQVTTELLAGGVAAILDGHDAAIGPAPDGGYWSIGLRHPNADVFRGVAMSTAGTLEEQRRRLADLGLRTAELPPLRDFDDIASAVAVASEFPALAFSRSLAGMDLGSTTP